MKIYDNGIIRDMTPEEIAEMERLQFELPPLVPSPDERLDAIEKEWNEMKNSYEEGVNNA